MFYDQAHITVQSGKGGNGAATFRREKFIAMGGPDGGSGGQGGDVIFRATKDLNTLVAFKYIKHYAGEDGQHGAGQKMHGKNGAPCILEVPIGTVIKEWRGEEILTIGDLTAHGQEFVAARGGRGGMGNKQIATPHYQSPHFAQLGAPGEEKILELELKLVADMGLIGLPNAGKSTLISVISNAKPKIAAYPFTTLVPNLGVVRHRSSDFVVADIPGLIEGANEGKGLGHEFLRHVERTRVLVHLIDVTSNDIKALKADFLTIMSELKAFNPAILKKPQVVVLTKTDLISADDLHKLLASKLLTNAIVKYSSYPLLSISAATQKDISALLDQIIDILKAHPKPDDEASTVIPTLRPLQDNDRYFEVELKDDKYYVRGKRAEEIVLTTDMRNEEALHWMRDRLKAMGVAAELTKRGIETGDTVVIANTAFDWE